MPNYSIFLKLKANIRFSIAEYLKYAYKLVQILGEPDTNSIVAIDETLITHHDGSQVWLVGAIETEKKMLG